MFSGVANKSIWLIPSDKSKLHATKSQSVFTTEAWNKDLCVDLTQLFCFKSTFFIFPHLSQHPSMLSGVFTSIGPKLIRSIPWDKSKFYASKSQPIFTIEAWNKGLCIAFAQIFCFKCTRLWLFFICLPTWPCYLAHFLASARNRWDWYHVIGANFMQMILS